MNFLIDHRARTALAMTIAVTSATSHPDAQPDPPTIEGSTSREAMSSQLPRPKAQAMALRERWWVAGEWHGIAMDHHLGILYALGESTTIATVNLDGRVLGHTPLALPITSLPLRTGPSLFLANLMGDHQSEFIVCCSRYYRIAAFATNGDAIWSLDTANAINDVAVIPDRQDAGRLNRVLLGLNGRPGLTAVNVDGAIIWTSSDCNNAWSLDLAGRQPGREPTAWATCTGGRVTQFDLNGHAITQIVTNRSPTLVRTATHATRGDVLVIDCIAAKQLLCLTTLGQIVWRTDYAPQSENGIVDAKVSHDSQWLAIAFASGVLAIYDIESGSMVASSPAGARQITWTCPGPDNTPLLVAAGFPLRAYALFAITE